MDERPLDANALINEIEGHLLVEATRGEGRAQAGRFARQFEWLSESQREEIEERYAKEYFALTRLSWRRTARRGEELRAEYQERYRKLRRRLVGRFLFGVALFTAAVVLVVSVIVYE
ncbi:hypothetical protein FE633_40005 [Streptomyces montanus]|uniref:Cytochrome C oxidase subunit I n=1 Tax=Streptomyces montanus TaxID=2580423 RepID=A0A5R9FIM4_9ACTN|nr:hypothetical protein [Streptomyces montanus]TLS40693.1 hypothetical protein FE633_40005 [Streptomyces montanus]